MIVVKVLAPESLVDNYKKEGAAFSEKCIGITQK